MAGKEGDAEEQGEGARQGQQQGIPIDALDPMDLMNLKRRMDADIQMTLERTQLLTQGKARFDRSKKALEDLHGTEGNEILVPLSESLYVPGRQANTEKVLVDVGTNYYVEKSRDDAMKYCERKSDMLKITLGNVEKDVNQKRQMSNLVGMALSRKLSSQRGQPTQPGNVPTVGKPS